MGVRGDTFRSDIAIDDIFIEPCSAPPTSSTQTIIKAPTSSSTGNNIFWECESNMFYTINVIFFTIYSPQFANVYSA